MNSQINGLISLFTLGILVGTPSFANVLYTKFSEDQKTKICADVENCDDILKSVPQVDQMDLHGICEHLLNKSHTATLELYDIASSLVNKTYDISIKRGYSICLRDYQDQNKTDEDIARDFKSGNFASVANRARSSEREVRSCVMYDFEYTETPVDPLLQQKVYGVSNIYYLIGNIADELMKEKEPGEEKHENKSHGKSGNGEKNEKKNKHGGGIVLNMKISKDQKTKLCDFVDDCDEVLKTIPQIEQKDLRGICEYLVNKTNAATMELNNIVASLVNKTEDREMKRRYSTCLDIFTHQKGFDQKIAKDFKSGNYKGVYERAGGAVDDFISYCSASGFTSWGTNNDPLFLQKLDEAQKMYVLIMNISGELNTETKGSGEKKHKNGKDKDSDGNENNIKKNKHGGVDASAPSSSAASPSPAS